MVFEKKRHLKLFKTVLRLFVKLKSLFYIFLNDDISSKACKPFLVSEIKKEKNSDEK